MKTDPPRFGSTAIALHWIIAALIVSAVILGLVKVSVDKGVVKDVSLIVHKSFGLLILFLACVRLAWRATHPAPPLPSEMGVFQRWAAWAAHALLYVLMFFMPITGYMSEAARGRETTFFWLFTLPQIMPLDRRMSHLMEEVHDASQYALYALLIAHIGAALYHRFILKDRILERMWPLGMTSPQ